VCSCAFPTHTHSHTELTTCSCAVGCVPTRGLSQHSSFTDLTGEDTSELPDGVTIDDPAAIEFTQFTDAEGVVCSMEADCAAAATCCDVGHGRFVDYKRRATTARPGPALNPTYRVLS
jgi:hypothetical protein